MNFFNTIAVSTFISGALITYFSYSTAAVAKPGDISHCKTLARLIDGPTYVDTPAGIPSMTYAELGLSGVDVGPVGGYIESWVKYDCEAKIGPWDGADKKWHYSAKPNRLTPEPIQKAGLCSSWIMVGSQKECI